MVALLGLLDLHAAILLCAIALSVNIPTTVLIATVILLFAKACISITDIGSLTDIAVVIVLIISIFITVPFWFLYILAAIIAFKGISSLAA